LELKKGRSPVNAGSAIESFRDMGFHTDSAICEIIDNSIEAKAKEIQIILSFKEIKLLQKYRRIEKFVFIDNGIGMDKEILFDCLVLGEGTKRNLNRGIGKFGVGATFAGISQGRFIGVYSKIKSGKWLYTQLDLDLLEQGEGIPEPIEKIPPDNYVKKLNDQGTIVIWDKIDVATTEKDLEAVKHHIGRIYRKFLTDKKLEDGKIIDNVPILLTLNGESIKPYDPMYLTFNPKVDDTELATIGESKEVDLKFGDVKTKMRITFSYLPESWWDDPETMYKPGMSTVNRQERKISAANMGMSIIREGREMAFGEIPFLKLLKKDNPDGGSSFAAEDRFTGIEVSFNRDADKIFGIEANKSRMFLPRYVRDKIGIIIREPLETRRDYFSQTRGKKEKTKTKSKGKSKQIIQNYMASPHYTPEEKEEVRKFAEKIGTGRQEIEEMYNDLIKGYLPIESWELDPTGPFVQFEHKLKSIVVKYNMNHSFMKKFFETLKDIAERKGEDPSNALKIEEIQRTKTLFDLLLASYGLAEIAFENPNDKKEIQSILDDLRRSWGKMADRITSKDITSE